MSSYAKSSLLESEGTELIASLSDPNEKGASEAYHYDKSQLSRYLCISGLAFSWTISIFYIIYGALNSRGTLDVGIMGTGTHNTLKDILILLQTAILLLCQEVLGYIHTVSLRWALHRNGKLNFNSNLRLWQNVKVTGPNAWYGNLIVVIGQVATFGSSAMTIAIEYASEGEWIWFLGEAWITLGIGIGMQAAVATWSILSWRVWPTWSSNPIDVAAACLHQGHNVFISRPGRALHGLDQINHPPMSMYPSNRQECAYKAHKDVRRVTFVIWIIPPLCFIWAATLLIIIKFQSEPGALSAAGVWNPLVPYLAVIVPLSRTDPSQRTFSAKDYLKLFVLICVLQSIIALSTHCAELHVNLTRDETIWRQAGCKKGLKRFGSSSLTTFLKSWHSIILLILKTGIQWFFSLTFYLDVRAGLYLYGPQTVYLAGTVLILCLFATFLALIRPSGPQPATFGHLQALVDLVDEWPGENDRMYWGDKGEYKGIAIGQDLQGVRHAGTSRTPLQPIDMSAEYA